MLFSRLNALRVRTSSPHEGREQASPQQPAQGHETAGQRFTDAWAGPAQKVKALRARAKDGAEERRATLAQVPRAEHAIVVLGTGDAEPRSRRVAAAARAAREDPKALLVLTGGAVSTAVSEADLMHDELVAQGIAPERMVRERTALFSSHNAQFAAALLAEAGTTKVTLVTERYHMGRARALFRRALREAFPDTAVQLRPLRADDELNLPQRMRKAPREAASRVVAHVLWNQLDGRE